MSLFEVTRITIRSENAGHTYPMILNTEKVEKIQAPPASASEAGGMIVYLAAGRVEPEVIYTVQQYDELARIVGIKPTVRRKRA